MIPTLTKAQADILTSFFSDLKQAMNKLTIGTIRKFGQVYPETYELPYNVYPEARENNIPTKRDGLKTMAETNKGLAAILRDIEDFSVYFDSQVEQHALTAALTAYVAQQEAALAHGHDLNSRAVAFTNELFAGLDFAGVHVDVDYEKRSIGKTKDGNMTGIVEISRTCITLQVSHKDAPDYTGIKLYPRNGQLASALKSEVQQAWKDLVQKATKVGELTANKVVDLKKNDRRLTNPEIELLAVLFTVSNLGQNAKYTIEGTKFTMVEPKTTADLTNLSNCRYVAKEALRNVMEEQEGYDAVNGEIRDWTKEFSAKKGKSTTLAGIAETWKEMIPLCHYLAINNK